MLKLTHEGFVYELPNISRYKASSGHRYLILCMRDGEVDCMFTSNGSLHKAKKDIERYYAAVYGTKEYSCVAYVRR